MDEAGPAIPHFIGQWAHLEAASDQTTCVETEPEHGCEYSTTNEDGCFVCAACF